jgi:hypothetical protein
MDFGLAAIAALTLALAGCKSEKETTAQAPAGARGRGGRSDHAGLVGADALEELVAPIALYPDLLVGPDPCRFRQSRRKCSTQGNWLLENQSSRAMRSTPPRRRSASAKPRARSSTSPP